MGTLYWRSSLPPLLAAALLLGLGLWLVVLYRRQRAQHSLRRTAALVLPKAAAALFVVLAYFDPVWKIVRDPHAGEKVAVLIDSSSSMQVADTKDGPRAARAVQLFEDLKNKLGPAIAWDAYEFDQYVRPYTGSAASAEQTRETDLGMCLATMGDKPDIARYLGVVVITDGGDETIQNIRLPSTPVYIAGVGSDPEDWDDVAIAGLDAPAAVEMQSRFPVAAEVVIRRGSGRFAPKQAQAQVLLEERTTDGWLVRAASQIDLRLERQALELSVESPAEQGPRDYRLRIDPLEGELSALNNVRVFSVEVGKDKLPILLFAQEVGWDFSMVRKELARDPALALTTLYRISPDRFVIQDNRQEGDRVLEAGFPTEPQVLDLYKCIILGSFPASQWQAVQMQALLEYVRQGGAVIFLGGGSSYAQGGYGNTILEPLFPWRLDLGGREFRAGQFAVNVPIAATNHRIVSDVARALARDSGPKIESLNSTGPLRSGAVALLETSSAPVVALQRYGQGHSLAIATDTLWKWTRASQAQGEAFRHFWRQAVRNVSQWQEGERFLSVRWDQPRYRPGERATATIGVAGRYGAGQVHLKTVCSVPARASKTRVAGILPAGVEGVPPSNRGPEALDTRGQDARDTTASGVTTHERTQVLEVAGVLGSQNEFTTSMVFRDRGDYVFRAEAYVGEKLLESYEKTLRVGPALNEGARLEVDHAFLDYLAAQSGGAYFRESDFGRLAETLRGRLVDQAVTIDMPLVQHNGVYIILLLAVLAVEWTLRRKMNLF
ncbi:MAG: hypothetical protein FJ280_25880 [Planctomycetes bacterium]|nr:hypothetical protein [Planctomycetota bacterium]